MGCVIAELLSWFFLLVTWLKLFSYSMEKSSHSHLLLFLFLTTVVQSFSALKRTRIDIILTKWWNIDWISVLISVVLWVSSCVSHWEKSFETSQILFRHFINTCCLDLNFRVFLLLKQSLTPSDTPVTSIRNPWIIGSQRQFRRRQPFLDSIIELIGLVEILTGVNTLLRINSLINLLILFTYLLKSVFTHIELRIKVALFSCMQELIVHTHCHCCLKLFGLNWHWNFPSWW